MGDEEGDWRFDSQRSVTRTAHWEWVWMQQVAARRVKAARKRGVQAEGLRTYHARQRGRDAWRGVGDVTMSRESRCVRRPTFGLLRYSFVSASMMKMSSGCINSFCTPLGAMNICLSCLMETPPPVPVTQPKS